MSKDFIKNIAPSDYKKRGSYSPAKKIDLGSHYLIFVSGVQAPKDDNHRVITDDIEKQTKLVFEDIIKILRQADASIDNVVKAVIYITNMQDFDKVSAIRGEYFKNAVPVSTLVEVNRMTRDGAKIEIEVTAMLEKKNQSHPNLIVLAGLPLSGKTELGRAIAENTDTVFFDIDETRQEISPGSEWLGPEKEKQIMLEAYKQNHQKAREALRLGKNVVVAATYSREVYHEMAKELATETGAALHFFVLTIPQTEVEKRIEIRKQSGTDSNITDMKSYAEVRDRYTPPPKARILNGTLPVDCNLQFIIKSYN